MKNIFSNSYFSINKTFFGRIIITSKELERSRKLNLYAKRFLNKLLLEISKNPLSDEAFESLFDEFCNSYLMGGPSYKAFFINQTPEMCLSEHNF